MTLLYPLGLLALVAVPVLVALSLWRWRRREVEVSSLLLWREVAAAWAQAPQTRRRRQLDPLVLVRVGVGLALAAALCGPVWLRPARLARRLVVVLDRSASMAARRPDGSTRWRAARDELLKLLIRLDAADRIELVALPPPADRAMPPELDPQEARSLLLAIEPSDAAVETRELVRAAAEALGRRPGAEVLIVTDGAVAGLPAGVRVLATGAPAHNRGIVAFATRPLPAPSRGEGPAPGKPEGRDGGREQVLVVVANAASGPASATVTLLADRREVARRALSLEPGGRQHAAFEARLDGAAVLEARLDGSDGLPCDDRAWLARRPDRVRVAWVGDECYFLRRALAVQSGVEVVEPAEPPADAPPRGCDLAVYYRAVPRRLAGGPVVVVAPAGEVGGLRPGPPVAARRASVVAPRDPLMAAVDLSGLALTRVPKPELPADFQTLAVADGSAPGAADGSAPGAAEGPAPGGAEGAPIIGRWRAPIAGSGGRGARLVYVGLDPAASHWPLDPSFPIFWSNVVATLSGRQGGLGGFASERPGDLIAVGEGEGEARLVEPDGARRAVAGGVFRPEKAGLYRVAAGPTERAVAVSLLSEGETLAAGSEARPPVDFLAPRPVGAASVAAAGRLAGWVAAAGLLLVVLHAWLAARRGA